MTGTRRAIVAIFTTALAVGASYAGRLPLGSGSARAAAQQSSVTFTKDVAPIIFSACASCHRPGGVAPFPLLTYDDVKTHAGAIVAATRDRVMPPWKPEPGYGEFADERRLTGEQIATLRAWVEGGAIEGDPALLPALPKWSGEWALGDPLLTHGRSISCGLRSIRFPRV